MTKTNTEQTPDASPNKGGRPAKGTLYETKSGWRARMTVTIDGERVKKSFDLETKDKTVARIRLKRLVLNNGEPVSELQELAGRVETFSEAAERIVGASKIKTKASRKDRIRLHVAPHLGDQLVTEIGPREIREVLETMVANGLGKQQCIHVRNDMSAVLGHLWDEGVLPENFIKKVKIPRDAPEDRRERAVLTDAELLRYLTWEHPEEGRRMAVLERQTMACISRMFGGVRLNDLRELEWSALDTNNFEWGWAPRTKTERPQRLRIPPQLRPFLVDWWERAGRKASGPVFPVRLGDRAGQKRKVSSIVGAFRRDLKRAFGIETHEIEIIKRSNGRNLTKITWKEARPMTPREVELLEDTKFTRRVDFHSFRRAYKQGLANAGVDIQTAMTLSGSSDPKAHARYLANTAMMAEVPLGALPSFDMAGAETLEANSPNLGDLQCRRADLNCRPHAYEAKIGSGNQHILAESGECLGDFESPQALTVSDCVPPACLNLPGLPERERVAVERLAQEFSPHSLAAIAAALSLVAAGPPPEPPEDT